MNPVRNSQQMGDLPGLKIMKNSSKISNRVKLIESNKTHLVFPRELLKTIDQFVGKRKRSKFVVEATEEKLARERFLKILKETVGTWKDKNHPELKTKKKLSKYIRKLRASFLRRQKRFIG